MIPVVVTLSLAAANATVIVASNTPAAAGNLTLNGATNIVTTPPSAAGGLISVTTPTITLPQARRVLVTYTAGEVAPRTLILTGGDRYGNPISETLTIPVTGTTIASQQDFLTITNVYVASAFSGPMSVGTNTTGSTQWFLAQSQITPANLSFMFVVSGTVTSQVDVTLMNPLMPLPSGLIVPDFFQPTNMSAITATASASLIAPLMAFRLTTTAGTGSVRMSTVQAGNYGG